MLSQRSGLPIVALAVTLLVHAGCAKNRAPTKNVKTYQYAVPEKTDDGWETAPLSSENITADSVNDLFDRVINAETMPSLRWYSSDKPYGYNKYLNIHSVLLVKNGKLVVEEYFPGQDHSTVAGTSLQDTEYRAFNRNTLHKLYSVTKSVNSILIGIAIDQHLISGVDEKISAFFPEYSDIFADSEKGQLRLKHLLSMTAGLSWDERKYPYGDSRNDHMMMNLSKDPVRYVLERPVATMPGTKFVYHSGLSITLGEIIHKVSGMRADKFAERYLFTPLGISDYFWWSYPNGTVQTGGGLVLRPRDMAKIGYLFLNGGRWQGKQIVSEEWVKESTKQHVGAGLLPASEPANGYGYQWWLGSFRVRGRVVRGYSAQGLGGQFIFVFPDLQMVAVFTGWNGQTERWSQPIDMLARLGFVPALSRYERAEFWIKVGWTWVLLIAGSLAVLVWKLAGCTSMSWRVRLFWVWVVVLLGPFGLLAYLLSRGQPARAEEPQAAMANWRCALREAVFSVVAYVGAWFLGLMCLAFFLHNPGLWHIPAVTYAALLIVGLLVFRTPLVNSRLGGRYWVALRRIAVTEIISVNFVVAGMAPMLFFVDHEVFSGFTPVFDPRFLLLTTGLASYGAFALYPFNAWMVHHRFDSLIVQLSAGAAATRASPLVLPTFRNALGVLCLSFILLIISLRFTVWLWS